MKRRQLIDRSATALMATAFLAAVLPLVAVLGYVVYRGASILSPHFLTQAEPLDFSSTAGGVWNGIKGTIKLLVLASAFAIPVGIATAVYLNEYGRGRIAGGVRFFTDVMTGVPSIFVGVFVYSLIVISTGGFSGFAGAVALAVIMLPIIVRATEEVLKLVPNDLREASLALGVRRWRTVMRVVLPSARAGIITGVMLAVGRAAGETAPLLFTSFGNRFVTGWTDVSHPDSALPLLIFRDARSAYSAAQARAWAGALILIVMVVAITTLTRTVSNRRARTA